MAFGPRQPLRSQRAAGVAGKRGVGGAGVWGEQALQDLTASGHRVIRGDPLTALGWRQHLPLVRQLHLVSDCEAQAIGRVEGACHLRCGCPRSEALRCVPQRRQLTMLGASGAATCSAAGCAAGTNVGAAHRRARSTRHTSQVTA